MAKKQPASTSGFKSYALSDQGVRTNNEDEVYADDDLGIYFVIDGMGGHAAGEQAARIAKERLLGRLNRATGSPQQRIREAIALANNAIFEAAEKRPDWNGMACVLTVTLVSSQTATIGHVGDSRLYKISGSSLDKITRDHSPVGELEDGKQLTEAEAMAHPRRNEVFRDVGSTRHTPDDKDFIDIYEIQAEPDSALLLCSDGLSDAVPSADIQRIISNNSKDPSAAVRSLIKEAKKQDGKDNISAVLVQGPAFGSPKRPTAKDVIAMPAPARPLRELEVAPPLRIIERQTPLSRKIAWSVLWMAAGAALFFGAQQLIHFQQSTPPLMPPKTAGAPVAILVNARKPGAQPTIAAALSVANEGDTIELAPGLYEEPIRIEKSNILLDGSGALLRPKPSNEGSDGITVARSAGVQIRNLRISGDSDGNLLTGINLLNSQVTLHNVHVVLAAGPGIEASGSSTLKMDAASIRDCSGPGLLLRGAVAATVKYSAIVGNGRDAGDHQPGIMLDTSLPVELAGNTIANNGGPAISQSQLPSEEILTQNLFSLDGRKGRLEDIRVNRKRTHP